MNNVEFIFSTLESRYNAPWFIYLFIYYENRTEVHNKKQPQHKNTSTHLKVVEHSF